MPSSRFDLNERESQLRSKSTAPARTLDVPTRDGGTVAVTTTGDGHDVLLLHGLGGNSTVWDTSSRQLSGGFSFFSVDLEGAGGSLRRRRLGYFGWLEDLDDIVNHLDIRAPIVVGHSMGSLIAQHYAATRRVSGICLVGPTMSLPRERHDAFEERAALARAHGMAHLLDTILTTIVFKGSPRSHPEVRDKLNSLYESQDAESHAQMCEALIRMPAPDYALLREVPTFLVAGSEDLVSPAALVAKLEERFDRCDVRSAESVGHWIMLEDPEWFQSTFNSALQWIVAMGR